jgi:hypothetical protein
MTPYLINRNSNFDNKENKHFEKSSGDLGKSCKAKLKAIEQVKFSNNLLKTGV